MAGERLAYESSKPRWKKPARVRAPGRADPCSDDDWLLCVRCGAPITREADRSEHGGLHEHSQVNAHGFIWVFGCYRDASGARAHGEPTDEFTWFAGLRWRLAECASCALHLGWQFSDASGGQQRFWGLISERLVRGGG